ncbi:MAG: M4 family metallopeptidase [Kofleriaceae bacterium]
MKRSGRLLRSLLGSCWLVAACSPTPQGEPPAAPDDAPSAAPEVHSIRLVNKDRTPLRGGPVPQAVVAYVGAQPALSGPRAEWKLRSQSLGADGLYHVRLRQYHDGVRVWGADVVGHATDQQVTMVSGAMAAHLDALDVTPSLASDAALSLAKADYAKDVKIAGEPLRYERESQELVILPGGTPRLAWHVVFYTELQAGVAPRLSNYLIDAKSGELLKRWNAIHTLSQASGPGGNAKVARTWTNALDVEPSGAQFIMDTARLRTLDLNHASSGGTIVTGPLSPIGDAPINDAHGFAEVTLNLLTDWGGYDSINNAGFKIISRVHYSTNYENAFWDGAQMTYGDGASTFYPLSGDVDVVSHEIHHGFTTFHSDLIYAGESGGMNESFSDIMGTAAEFYAEGLGADWDLGRDIFRGDTALRFMCDPTADGRSIDNYADYVDGIDVHFSSGIMNKAFCRAARRLASGSPTGDASVESVQRVAKAFYLANEAYWTSNSTFAQGCQGTMDATAALGWSTAERDALRTSWADSGVYCDGLVEPIVCDETLTAESGTLTSPNYPGNYPNNFRRTWCIQPASGNPATLHFTAFNTELGYDFVTIKDAFGTQLSQTSGTTPPPDATSTLLAVRFTSDVSVVRSGFQATWTASASNAPPTVAITSPASGANLAGMVNVAATASDDGSVAHVRFELPDGTMVEDATAPYGVAWDSTTVADGASYLIRATAFDNLGAASTPATVTIAIRNAVDCLDDTFAATGLPLPIPDNQPVGVTSSLEVAGVGAVGSLALSLRIQHTFRGDLRVRLSSPTGTTYLAHNRSGGSADDVVLVAHPVTAFDGEPATGTWRLFVQDLAGADVGSLVSWSLHVVGACLPSVTWSASGAPDLALVDNGAACTSLTVESAGDASAARLDLSGMHSWRSTLRGTLAHNGTTIDAFPINTFPANSGTFELTGHRVSGLPGSASGVWTLCVVDTDAFNDSGVLATWSVHN